MAGGAVDPLGYVFAAVPGVLALAGAAVSHGRTQARLKAVEKDVQTAKDLGEKVARIDERTIATASSVKDIKGNVDRLVEHLLTEPRTFDSRTPRRR